MKKDLLKIKKLIDRDKDLHRIGNLICPGYNIPQYRIDGCVVKFPGIRGRQGVRIKDVKFNLRKRGNRLFFCYNYNGELIDSSYLLDGVFKDNVYFIVAENIMYWFGLVKE